MLIFVFMLPEGKIAEQPVSLRKFAAMTGMSDGGVRKAVGKKSITNGFVDGKILPGIASVEWGKAILDGWVCEAGSWKLEAGSEVTDNKEADPCITDVSLIADIPNSYSSLPEGVIDDNTEASADDEKSKDQFLKDIPEGTSKIEAERLFSVYRARKAKRDLQKVEGELVDKRLVYNSLFEFAAIMRDTFLNIPDRVIDNILAADTRNEAIEILTSELTSVLVSLANIGEIKLTAAE